jgi:hypothetical protein
MYFGPEVSPASPTFLWLEIVQRKNMKEDECMIEEKVVKCPVCSSQK